MSAVATDFPEFDPQPETCSVDSVLVYIECEPTELTAEDLARPRYGRPNPRRHLPDDEPPPATPPDGRP